MTKHFLVLITLLSSLIYSCSDKKLDQANVTPGYWGAVNQLELIAPTSLYLLFVKPQDVYEVCVASHLTDEHPQIITEIDASIKIWGRYINRHIETNIKSFPMPAPIVTEHQDVTFDKFVDACPDADIVVGYGNINSVGLTANKYSYIPNSDGLQVPINPSRILFLQNPAFKKAVWHSYVKDENIFSSSEQLISKLMERAEYQLLEKVNEYSTLNVLMHEFGHVWGLCDMYPLAGGHTNCHPIWSKKDDDGNILLVPSAKMAAVGWKNPLFLHDDDIEGIRTLAARERYMSLWQNQNSFPQVAELKEADFLFKFVSTVLEKSSIVYNFALYTTQKITLEIQLNSDRGPLRFNPIQIQGPVDTNQYGLNLGFPEGLIINSLKVIIKNEDGDELTSVDTQIKA